MVEHAGQACNRDLEHAERDLHVQITSYADIVTIYGQQEDIPETAGITRIVSANDASRIITKDVLFMLSLTQQYIEYTSQQLLKI